MTTLLKKLDRILAAEIAQLTLIIMAALSSVMFMFRLLSYADYIFVSSDGLMSIFMFVMFLLPSIFKLTVPVSLLLATTIVILRMASDRELEAWMSSGVGVVRMAATPLAMGGVVMLLSGFSALILEPYSRQEWQKFKWMSARKSVEAIIENRLREKTFLGELFSSGDTTIAFYTDTISESRKDFTGVFLAVSNKKSRYSAVLVANAGSLQKEFRDGFSDYVFTLRDGHYYQPSQPRAGGYDRSSVPGAPVNPANPFVPLNPTLNWSVVKFEELKVSLVNMFSGQFDPGAIEANDIRSLYPSDYWAALAELRKDPDWKENQRNIRNHSYFYEQIVVPFSCLFLPLIGLCLGIQDPRRKSGMAYLGLGVVAFVYYANIMLCQQLATRRIVPPEVTLYLPPVVLTAIALVMLRWRGAYPPSIGFKEFARIEWDRLARRGAP